MSYLNKLFLLGKIVDGITKNISEGILKMILFCFFIANDIGQCRSNVFD